ncbi:hypothetical protein B566_EDAN017359 [Ephemera danica]|nr:hypothetical protein B566_EDAN017359 [Ephemera danica]
MRGEMSEILKQTLVVSGRFSSSMASNTALALLSCKRWARNSCFSSSSGPTTKVQSTRIPCSNMWMLIHQVLSGLLEVSSTTVIDSVRQVFNECELAQYLRSAGAVRAHIPVWTCIAYYESRYNTTALGKINNNGSRDHGIFQLNDKYWCKNVGVGGGCKDNCAFFRDNSIANDIRCAKTIYAENQRLQGDGFNAWSTYKTFSS